MILLYGIVFFVEILLTWATLQQPYMSKTLSASPPQNKNDWVHSVIFEPQPKMILTRSTYKITSFLDFQPFLQGFQTVDKYIRNLMIDIANPTYFKRLITPYHNIPPVITSNWSVKGFLMSPGCADRPYACRTKLKFDQLTFEVQYMYKIFQSIYKKFLTAIDHIDYHPSQQYVNNNTRVKRSDFFDLHGHYHSPTRKLTPSENNFLDAFLRALNKINPTLHNEYVKNEKTRCLYLSFGMGNIFKCKKHF